MDESTVGLSFGENKFLLVEIEHSQEICQVNQITQKPLPVNLDFLAVEDVQNIPRIAEPINEVVAELNLKGKRTALSLNNALVMIKKVPVDEDLDERELRGQIRWEAEQHVLSSMDDYILDYQRLFPISPMTKPEVLMVLVRKKIIDFLRELFQATSLDLRWIDVDIFAAHRALEVNYDLRGEDKIAMVEVGKRGLCFTLLMENEFFLTHSLAFAEGEEEEFYPPISNENASKLIAKELRRLILDNRLGQTIEDLDWVFLYGDRVDKEIAVTLQSIYPITIEVANPFRRLRMSPEVYFDREYLDKSGEFLVAVGSGLRRV